MPNGKVGLGVYLVVRAIAELAFGATKLFALRTMLSEQAPGSPLPASFMSEFYGTVLGSGVELLLGVVMIARVAGLQSLLVRLRGRDSD